MEYIFNKDNNLYSNIEICFDKNEKDKYIRIYSNNKKLFLNIKKNSITLNKIDLSKLEKCLMIDFVSFTSKEVTVEGWVRNHRKQKEIGIIDFNG